MRVHWKWLDYWGRVGEGHFTLTRYFHVSSHSLGRWNCVLVYMCDVYSACIYCGRRKKGICTRVWLGEETINLFIVLLHKCSNLWPGLVPECFLAFGHVAARDNHYARTAVSGAVGNVQDNTLHTSINARRPLGSKIEVKLSRFLVCKWNFEGLAHVGSCSTTCHSKCPVSGNYFVFKFTPKNKNAQQRSTFSSECL